MTQALPNVTLNGSRLVRFLSSLAVSDVEVSHSHFAERLGRLIDLPDAISLSEAHGELRAMARQPSKVSDSALDSEDHSHEEVIEKILTVRNTIVQFMVKSFDPTSDTWLKIPTSQVKAAGTEAKPFEAYFRFYTAHQRDIQLKVQRLRVQAREAISSQSPKLAQLCALDSALDDTLVAHCRKLFAVVPKLLGQRYQYLSELQQSDFELQPNNDKPPPKALEGEGLAQFLQEMQGLLLAELEVRLQPVVGLIEALNEEVDQIHE